MSDILYLLSFRPFQESLTFQFPDPDSGRLHKANTRAELIKLIVNYRAQNGYEQIENLNLVLDNYLCSLPENQGKCAPYVPLQRGVVATLKGALAVITSMLYKSFVSQDEADRRSEICNRCPHNVFPDKGYFITWSDAVAEASVGKKKSIWHEQLGNCEVCSCPLRAKVFYSGDMGLDELQKAAMRKVGCWQTEV